MASAKNQLIVYFSRHTIIYLVIQQFLLLAKNGFNHPPLAVKAKLIAANYEFGVNLRHSSIRQSQSYLKVSAIRLVNHLSISS